MGVDVKWLNGYLSPAQIYNGGVELSICSDDNRQIGPFVYCKDFFQDAIVAAIHGDKCRVYGYKYDPDTDPPIPVKNLKVLLANAGDKAFGAKGRNVIDFLNQIEEQLGVAKTTIEACNNPPRKYASGVYLLTADPVFMLAPPLLSMWTLFARNGPQHTAGKPWTETVQGIIDGKIAPAQTHDKTYMAFGKPGLDLILEKGIKAVFGDNQKANYPKDKAGHTMHHMSGIVSFGSCKAKPHFPDWQYPAIATEPPGVCFA